MNIYQLNSTYTFWFSEELDQLQLNFSEGSLDLLMLLLAFIMFGVALSLKVDDFRRLLQVPRAILVGLASQLLILPLITLLLARLLPVPDSIALGMMLVACCPGGSMSNFISQLARADVALSVSLTALSSTLSIIWLPLGFAFWSAQLNLTEAEQVSGQSTGMIKSLFFSMLLPLILGMLMHHYRTAWSDRIREPIRKMSLLIFALFIVLAVASNLNTFWSYFAAIFLLVLLHNGSIWVASWLWASALRLAIRQRRAVSIETAIQNSGLGLLIAFTHFPDLGGMALVCAWWGVWHLVSGYFIAALWSRRDLDVLGKA